MDEELAELLSEILSEEIDEETLSKMPPWLTTLRENYQKRNIRRFCQF
jgi:hypothetical protein